MKESGLRAQTFEMAVASRSGLMAPVMRVIGRTTRLMAEVDLFTLMAMSTKENGRMIRHTEEESTPMLMAADMKANGWKTNSTDLVLRDGQTVPHTKDSTCRERSTARASSPGLTTAPTLVTFTITTSTVQEFMSGLMAESSPENGATIRWRATAPSLGLTDASMLVNTLMI